MEAAVEEEAPVEVTLEDLAAAAEVMQVVAVDLLQLQILEAEEAEVGITVIMEEQAVQE